MTRIRDNERFDTMVGSRQPTHSSHVWGDRMAEEEIRRNASLGARLRGIALSLVLAVCVVALTAAGASAASFTWSGAAPAGTPNWSSTGNWVGGTAPSTSVETLTFPELSSVECPESKPSTTHTCYQSNNNLLNLNVNAISIDDHSGYSIMGSGIILGAGGIKGSTLSTSGLFRAPYFFTPITLGAPQTWSFDGNAVDGQVGFAEEISGPAQPLTIEVAHFGGIDLEAAIEAGPMTIKGTSTPAGVVALFPVGPKKAGLNGTDGNPVNMTGGASLIFASGQSTVGPLTMSGGYIGTFIAESGMLSVNGSATLDSTSTFAPNINQSGTVAGTDYSQLNASGSIGLGNAKLSLSGASFPKGGGTPNCPTLSPNDVDTLVNATGGITGKFAGVENGAELTVNCSGFAGTPPTVRIKYTPNAVTATVLPEASGGGSGNNNNSNNNSNSNTATTATTSGGVQAFKASGPPPPVIGQSENASVLSGTATVHAKGSSGFVPLTGASSIPDGSEVDATNGRVLITTATLTPGKTQSAEVYGGRFKVQQDAKGIAHLILTLPLTGCPRVTLPHGSAAAVASAAKHAHSGPKSRHLWVSETGGKWGTNGRYVSTTVEGTNWLTLDECNQSQVTVVAGKVQVHDLVHNKTKTLTAGQHLSAIRSARKH
jgi:hypothetical protein